LFIVLRAQIVRVILGAGNFSWSDTRLTAACLAIFAVSVVAQSLCQLFIRAYYAAGRTRTPLLVNIISAGIIIISAFGFSYLFKTSLLFRYWLEALLRVEDLTGTAVLILPLAFSVGLIFNAVAYWIFFARDFTSFSRQTFRGFFQTLSASLLGGLSAYEVLNLLEGVFDVHTFVGIFLQGFLAGLTGLVTYVVILLLMNNDEVKEVGLALSSKFWKAKVVAPSAEEL